MSYLTQSKMARDRDLIMRIAACAATEGVPGNPSLWADDRRQKIVASPGWVAAYASACTSRDEWVDDGSTLQPPPPGENEAAITDGMILSAVQLIIAAETPPPVEGEQPHGDN